jgi:predicted DCC family thiol-disulfide oxidoreductase YuxK
MAPVHDREFEIFFDGACPLCRREIDWIRGRDRQQRLLLTDISAPQFDPQSVGKTYQQLMARIHGRLPSGEMVEGVDVFRRMYQAVGFKTVVRMSRWPVVKQILEASYIVFAKLRKKRNKLECTDQTCSLS